MSVNPIQLLLENNIYQQQGVQYFKVVVVCSFFAESILFAFMLLYERVMRKPTFWFPTWSDTNRAVQLQKMARGLKFRI